MKVMVLAVALIGLVACAPAKEKVTIISGVPGADGSSCSVSDYYQGEEVIGAQISCTDGSSVIVLNGSDGTDGLDGLDGLDGEDGLDGVNGKDGKSCTVKRKRRSNYAVITCGRSTVRVYNGQDGKDGANGTNGDDGANGTNGDDGAFVNGELTSISTTSSCTVVDDLNSAKLNGNSGEVRLYNTTNCLGSHTSLHDGEVAITSNGNLLFNVVGTNNLQLIKFN